ncbi:MAG: cell division protein ZapE [Actinobacteria bacterium HGW-Actinobacteria-4]|nr:MAG: cell division protein ZapE [Actinobacteria bacterium HGW-Actinobacteria-4]
MKPTLLGRRPDVPTAALIGALRPPHHFAHATFETYSPDPEFPSQAAALGTVRAVAASLKPRSSGSSRSSGTPGLYLDGGFGVGKTHLLAALAHAVPGAAFATFVEYTSLVGALGFPSARRELQEFRLVCIDEFELDDPGDTLLMARLMRELADAGVALAATSNTPPGSLGLGRFAAADFQREIQSLASSFQVVSIDGPDYRHRETHEFPPPDTEADVRAQCDRDGAVCEDFGALVGDLAHVHPSRYNAYLDGIDTLGLTGVAPLRDQNQALRWVSLVDRLYDRDVRLIAAGEPLADVFTPDMMKGGYRKKYLRALSRMLSLVVGEDEPSAAQGETASATGGA